MKKVAILQSNYLPWKGVFDLIHRVDVFIFLEDVQYTVRDWRNRNLVLTNSGPTWITVPIRHSNQSFPLIGEMEIDNSSNWSRKHFNAFKMNYGRAQFYKEYEWILEDLYLNRQWEKLSDLNIYSTKLIASILGIKTEFINSFDFKTSGTKDDKLIMLCKKVSGDFYLSGPAAQNYIVPEKFSQNNIKLDYITYEYPEYKQLHQPFNHHVTVLDLLFNCGPDSAYYIWGWKEKHEGVF